MVLKSGVFVLLLVVGASADGICPDSPAYLHAGCEVKVSTASSCDQAHAEVVARINGQYEAWHDPHNNGTYAIYSDNFATGGLLSVGRVTGDGKYTDHVNLGFTNTSDGCDIDSCSESQVNSVSDYSTNYCNSRMLYCGTLDGCKPVQTDLDATETSVVPSFGASANKKDCLVD